MHGKKHNCVNNKIAYRQKWSLSVCVKTAVCFTALNISSGFVLSSQKILLMFSNGILMFILCFRI